ncbi:MAG TPA: hypothetical protein VKV20_16140 [Ktedonobacteraceae bacterium]|nr:hypothetical protein [Ktedonobacteraceae bacterium]
MQKNDQPSPLPVFTNHDVGENYKAGLYYSLAEAELDDILKSGFARTLPSEQESESASPSLDTAAGMIRLAIIDNGTIIPVMSIARIDTPQTVAQRMALCALAARAVIDSLLEVFATRQSLENDNGDENKVST